MANGGKPGVVGIADMKLAQNGERLITYALGSCIGICLYDARLKLAALVHIMLPLNMEAGRHRHSGGPEGNGSEGRGTCAYHGEMCRRRKDV